MSAILVIAVLAGCKGKHAEDSGPPSSVMLDAQTGAVLVRFPKLADFDRESWMSQIQLEGGVDTRALPRVPMADLQSTLVLNVPSGVYRVTAVAWVRKLNPTSGGALDSVIVRPGEISILVAQPVGTDRYPFAFTKLQPQSPRVWRLPRKEEMHEYIADLMATADKG
ncbi:hypothetical protein HZB60_10775 [candidate division KSB1 bacterium]|nr:hypothetical protein [candidate division KSB1 bacterium]